jgi:signal transduction histidine kinase
MDGEALDEQRLRRLIDAGRVLVSEQDPDAVFERLLETAREVTGARYAALGILDRRRRGLERFITLGIDQRTRQRIGKLPRGRGVLGLLIDNPQPLRLEDVASHPSSYGFPPNHPPMNSFLGVPILIRGAAWGNLYLTEKEGGSFNEADEDAAVILAEWAAIAIGNARSVAEERLRESIESSERERGHWSRELHDETLQSLGSLRILLASALRRGSGPELAHAVTEAVDQLAEEIEKLRGLISDLRPAALDEIGLQAALEGLTQRTATRAGLDVRTEFSWSPSAPADGGRLDRELENAIYRVAQEALTNAARHARAERVDLRLQERDGRLELAVEDDGVGFDPEARHEGFGLRGMRERVELLDGSLEVSSEPGAGTTLRAVFPRTGAAPDDAYQAA